MLAANTMIWHTDLHIHLSNQEIDVFELADVQAESIGW